MRTHSSSNLPVVSPSNPSTSNPKRRNCRRSKQPFILEESPIDTMADQRTMTELLRCTHRDESFHEACDRYKDLLRACPHHGFTELHQLDTFYNALNPADQDSLNAAVCGNLLERRTQDVLMIMENKYKIAKLTHAVNQQMSDVTTAMTAILKQFQATPPPASVKAVEEICVTCGAAVNYNQGNVVCRPPEDERVDETLMDQDLSEYAIKVPPPHVQKYKPPSQRDYVVYQRDPLHPNIPYPSRMLKQK
nr:reverse transcriptase domain-containing protein [Tanacetum cinerariifolium]